MERKPARRIARLVAVAAVLVALGGSAWARVEPTTLRFSKEDPDGDATWTGTVSGPTEGDLTTVLVAADRSRPVWLVAFDGSVDAAERSFRLRVGGTLDTTAGRVVMTGVVTEGHGAGSTVQWEGRLVDAEASRFAGTLRIVPSEATTAGSQAYPAGVMHKLVAME